MPANPDAAAQPRGEGGPSTIPRRSLQAEIASRLRDEIVEGEWAPGSRIQERILCERYGVSRSPLREAFQIMVKEGLLELLPGRGAVVTRPTMTDAVENMEVLVALEALAISLACERANDEELTEIGKLHEQMRQSSREHDVTTYFKLNNLVHRDIVAASGNASLIATHDHIQRHITRLQNLSGALEATTDDSLAEHDAFIRPLLARDADAAAAALKAHLRNTIETIKERILASEGRDSARSTRKR